ncbi:MAG: ABC transporter substrate-binding protein [Candidatus Dormibacteria bacterium]
MAPTGPSPLSALLDPGNPISQTVGALSQPGLLKSGPNGTPILGLAASWKELDKGAKFAFTLPRNGRWSNGQPITTRDVGFTLAVLQSAAFPDPSVAAPWRGISLFATSFWSGTFVLPAPAPNFPNTAEVAILPASHFHDRPQAFLAGNARPTSHFPPAAGPFAVVGNGPDQVSLRRNRYYSPLPLLAGFNLDLEPSPAAVASLLARGRVDGWLAATPADVAALPASVVKGRMVSYSFVELLMNESSPPLGNPVMRRALAAAIGRRQLVAKGVGGLGVPQYGPLPQSIAWAALGSSSLAVGARPAAMLAGLGYQRTPPLGAFEKAGRRLALTISVPSLQPLPQAAAALASMLDRQGFTVTVVQVRDRSFMTGTLSAGRFQLALVGFDNGPDPNLTAFWGSQVQFGQSLNFSRAPVDPILNHELDQLATATSLSARKSAYRAVTARLAQDAPAVFLYTPVYIYAHLATVHVPGIPLFGDPLQRFADVTRWSL